MTQMIRRKATGTVYKVLDQVRDERSGMPFDAWWVEDEAGCTRKFSGQQITREFEPVGGESMPALSRDLIYGIGVRVALEFAGTQPEDSKWSIHDLARVIIDAVWDQIKESTE